jgi:hypothetical protein
MSIRGSTDLMTIEFTGILGRFDVMLAHETPLFVVL